ncbi:hypothetical protein PsorP6_017298 [Peronosclerospora sorghi]|uniref:Uncharacterized protein n=1 Tax=Peronosclerospora sorghi TaxID=230839 RepID=A0ACC0WP28_9STRA|nr:hypothetical protein PsorP6_017298 [Peronosclerospora sorghi]
MVAQRKPGEASHEMNAAASPVMDGSARASKEAEEILEEDPEGTSGCLPVEAIAEADESTDVCPHVEEHVRVEDSPNSRSE